MTPCGGEQGGIGAGRWSILDTIESATGMDLDGNGTIGVSAARNERAEQRAAAKDVCPAEHKGQREAITSMSTRLSPVHNNDVIDVKTQSHREHDAAQTLPSSRASFQDTHLPEVSLWSAPCSRLYRHHATLRKLFLAHVRCSSVCSPLLSSLLGADWPSPSLLSSPLLSSWG